MYHNKQIAVFISHIYGEYQTNLCQGILDSASEYGYHAEVFTTSDGENLGVFNRTEDHVASLPEYSDYDGIIFASGTYVNQELKKTLSRTFQDYEASREKEGRFVVEISNDPSPFLSVVLENNVTTGILTEHLITAHHATRICYLGTTLDPLYSGKRLKAYEDALQKHNLPISPEHIFLCEETDESYREALRAFTENGKNLPHAVVCYNDRLAMEFIRTAYEAGYHVPADFAVVGCDQSKSGQSMDPPLTTVTFPAYQLGQTAVKSLLAGFKNAADPVTTVFAEPVYGGTCGCDRYGKKPAFLYARELTERIADVEKSILESLRMSSYLPMIDDVDEAISYLEDYASGIKNLSGFYLCLYPGWDKPDAALADLALHTGKNFDPEDPADTEPADQVYLKLAIQNGEKLPECTFPKKSLLPGFLTASMEESVIISPLSFGERLFGYIALSFHGDRIHYPFQLIQWITNISQLLEKIRSKKQAMLLTGKLEDIYYKDSLTGLCSRDGFDHFYEERFRSLILIDFADYQKICSKYGVQEGDFALSVIGQAILSQQSKSLLCAHIRGGLFQIAAEEEGAFCEDLTAKIRKYLTHYSQLNPRPYEIKARFGFAVKTETDLPFDALFAAAEENLK